MMEEGKFWLWFWALFFVVLILMTGVISFAIYKSKQIRIANFENTIQELTDEQKCLHICGFEWHGVSHFDNYKFCVEKCDRISERESCQK